jgi:hypothetical protein
VPHPTALTAPYWAAAARRELVIQRCGRCARWVHFPRATCPACGSGDLAFRPVSGDGTVYTFSVVHRAFVPGLPVPYAIAWIDLPEQPGLRAFGGLVGCPPEAARIGMPVRVCFTELPGFGAVPDFRPRGER